MTQFLVYLFLAAVMCGSALLAVAGFFALVRGGCETPGWTATMTALFAFNTLMFGSIAREYARD